MFSHCSTSSAIDISTYFSWRVYCKKTNLLTYLPLQGITSSGLIFRMKYSPPGLRPWCKQPRGTFSLGSSSVGSSGWGLSTPRYRGRKLIKTCRMIGENDWKCCKVRSSNILSYSLNQDLPKSCSPFGPMVACGACWVSCGGGSGPPR